MKYPQMTDIRVLTWNMLNDAYAFPCRYPWVSPASLAWSRRQSQMASILVPLSLDFICAQEVSEGNVPELPGMTWVYGLDRKRRKAISKGNHVMTCALAYRGSKWCMVGDPQVTSRTLTCTFRAAGGGDETFRITSLHLPVDTSEQLVHLRHDLGDVVAGDFNNFPGTAPVRALCDRKEQEGYVNVYDERTGPKSTYYLNDVVDYVFIRPSRFRLKSICWASPHHPIPNALFPSDHLWIMAVLTALPH